MALFGLIRQAGETLRVDIREWMGTEYFTSALAGAIGLFVEEASNAAMLSMLKLTDWKATAYKTIHRLAFSALYYFGGKKMFGKPGVALTMSIFPVAMIFIDAINKLLKVNDAKEAGLRLAAKFKRTATASAYAVQAQPVIVAEVTTESPGGEMAVIPIGGSVSI